jgi:carboxylate-amine ligase
VTAVPLRPPASAERLVAGSTLGVEEEFHVVDAATLALRDDPDLNAAALSGALGRAVSAEIATTQLETSTAVCSTLGEVRTERTLSSAR